EAARPVDRRPLDVVDRDRLALVQRIRQPPVDLHPTDEPPLLGHAVEGVASLLAQEVQWHVASFVVAVKTPRWRRRPAGRIGADQSSDLKLFSRIVSTTAASASVVVSPSW